MGGSFFFFIESKSFEFCVEEGGSFFSLRIFERGRYSLRSVFMSKEGAKRLLSLLEDFISSKPPVTLHELLEMARQFLFYSWVSTHMATSLCIQNSYMAVGKASLLFRKEIWVVVGEDLVLT